MTNVNERGKFDTATLLLMLLWALTQTHDTCNHLQLAVQMRPPLSCSHSISRYSCEWVVQEQLRIFPVSQLTHSIRLVVRHRWRQFRP
ncbi:hypothetical protein CPC08DRAFT_188333 [Agrocybe pediades]|nr:hypothetical protein CPC08DRAFT_188333 [Agrocybe pediades]